MLRVAALPLFFVAIVSCGGRSDGAASDAAATTADSAPLARCMDETQCASDELCSMGVCVIASCADGVLGGTESDIDCGGACRLCTEGESCFRDGDCSSNFCGERDTCEDCTEGADQCADGKVCAGGVCVDPSCSDGAQAGSESDIDCGGDCPLCNTGQTCTGDWDCLTGFCAGDGTCSLCGSESDCAGSPTRTCTGGNCVAVTTLWTHSCVYSCVQQPGHICQWSYALEYLSNSVLRVDVDKINSTQTPTQFDGNPSFNIGNLLNNECDTAPFAAGTTGLGQSFSEDIRVCRSFGQVNISKDTYVDGTPISTPEIHCARSLAP